MAKIGIVEQIEGKFFIKDEQGNVKELKVGDEIYSNDIVFSDVGNDSNDKVIINVDGTDKTLTINSKTPVEFDSTLLDTALNNPEAITQKTLNEVLQNIDIDQQKDEDGDIKQNFTNYQEQMIDIDSDVKITQVDGNVTAEFHTLNSNTADFSGFIEPSGLQTDINSTLRSTPNDFEVYDVLNSGKTSEVDFGSSRNDVLKNDKQIPQNNATISITAGAGTVNEGDTTTAYTISIDKPASEVTSPITVELIYSGTASDGSDYTKVAQVVIPAGKNSTTFTLDTIDDTIAENTENIIVSIGNITDTNFDNVIKDSTKASVTTKLIDNEPSISINDITINEDSGTATFTVTLNKTLGSDVTFKYATADDGAIQPDDYTSTTGNGTITAGQTTTTITVPIKDDYLKEGSEKFFVNLSNQSSNVSIVKAKGVGTIVDGTNDATPNQDVDTVYLRLGTNDTVQEGENGTLTHTISLVDKDGNNVNLKNEETIKVALSYSNDTTESEDFATNGKKTSLTITGNGTSNYTFSNTIKDDFLADNNESYIVSIGSITSSNTSFENLSIDNSNSGLNNKATGTITDGTNDATPNQNIDTVYAKIGVDKTSVGEGGNIKYTVSLVDKDGNAVTVPTGKSVAVAVNWTGTTTGGTDTSTLPSTITIAGGTNNTQITVSTTDDYFKEGNETLIPTISGVTDTNNSFEKVATHTTANEASSDAITTTTTIKDGANDATPNQDADTVYAVITGNGEVNEGSNASYTVKLLDKAGNEVRVTQNTTVKVKFTNGTTQDADTNKSNNDIIDVTISANSSTGTFTINTVDDYMADNNENFTVAIDSIPTHEFEKIDIDGFTDSGSTTHSGSKTTTIKDDSGTPNNQTDGVESTHQSVIIKLVALDSSGNPLLDGSGNYTFVNDVKEGASGKYMALAFKPDETDFKPANKLANQEGTITINLADGTSGTNATGATSQTTKDGTQDFDNVALTNVTLGTVINVATFDDYVADNNETFKVNIKSGSYANPTSGGGYENVAIDSTAVVSTIKDGVNDATANEVNNDRVIIKLIACDENGNKLTNTNGTYKTVNSVDEGATAKYMALAFKPGTTEFKASNEVTTQSGTIKVNINNGTATGAASLTAKDGTQDFDNDEQTVTLGTAFGVKTFDDFTAENNSGENYNLTIEANSYTAGTTAYENVDIKTDAVTTTIKDDISLGTTDNAYVDEDKFDATNANATITGKESNSGGTAATTNPTLLNITTKANYNDYDLIFDSGVEPTGLKSGGKNILYDFSTPGKVIGYLDGGSPTNDKVFEVTLDKNNAGGSDDGYTYTQYKNIDHPKGKDTSADSYDDTISFDVGFKIKDKNGTTATDDDVESPTKNFTIYVNDSVPKSTSQLDLETKEDSPLKVVISKEAFKDGEITLNNGVTTKTTLSLNQEMDVYDSAGDDVVGKMKNNGDGTLTFTPNSNYSGDIKKLSYEVFDGDGDRSGADINITVKPVADAPTIATPTAVSTNEDNSNANEGTNSVTMGLTVPTIADTKDQNDGDITTNAGTTAGDNPERLGYIELKFTNGTAINGAILEKSNGTDLATISSNNQIVKIAIVDSSGNLDKTLHYSDLDLTASGVIKLTKAEYEALKIIPKEDNATNIKYDINATSYETKDNGDALDPNKTNADLYKTAKTSATIDVKAVTDDVTLQFSGGSTTHTLNINDYEDGTTASTAIDLKAILDVPGFGDNDGSEDRSYTLTGLPIGTIIQLGSNKVIVADPTPNDAPNPAERGTATIKFPSNTDADPDFTMKLPEHFSTNAPLNIGITVKVKDTDKDSTVTAAEKSATVNLKIEGGIAPRADDVTLQVKQAKGDEDAGRSQGNTSNVNSTASNIDEPQNGIDLDIKATSADKDGSESFTITIDKIPDGGAIYYKDSNGTITVSDAGIITGTNPNVSVTDNTDGTWKVEIAKFDNNAPLKFIPPHNSDNDYVFDVSAVSVDRDGTNTNTLATVQHLDLKVTVDDVADKLVNNELATATGTDDNSATHKFTVVKDEATLDGASNKFLLQEIYNTPNTLNTYDSDTSEVATFKVTGLADGFSIEGASFLGGSGTSRQWSVTLADLKASNKVYVKTPAHYSGEFGFKIEEITTEKEGDSHKENQDVKVLVTPSVDATLTNLNVIQKEDEWKELKFDFSSSDKDLSEKQSTSLKDISIDVDALKTKGISLKIEDSLIDLANDTRITGKYLKIDTPNGAIPKIEILNKQNDDNNYNFGIKYTVADTITSNGHTYTNEIEKSNTYKVTVEAVTESVTLKVTDENDPNNQDINLDISSGQITVNNRPATTFTKELTLKSGDIDGSEKFTRIEVTGLPEGLEVVGGVRVENNWYIDIADITISNTNGAKHVLTFETNGKLSVVSNQTVTIKAVAQDNSPGAESFDTGTFKLNVATSIATNPTGTTDPAIIDNFTFQANTSGSNEDNEFTLGDNIAVATTGSSDFSIKITAQSGAKITGTGISKVGEFWLLKGNGDENSIKAALNQIKVTPPEHFNTNNPSGNKFELDLELTTYGTNGLQNHGTINNYDMVINPITDYMDFHDKTQTIKVDEDTTKTLSISLKNAKDGDANVELSDTNKAVYIKATDVSLFKSLKYNGNEILTNANKVTNPKAGLSGEYYKVELGNSFSGNKIDFAFTPKEQADGNVSFDVFVPHKQTHSISGHDSTEKISKQNFDITIDKVADTPTVTAQNSSGDEDKLIELDFNVTIPDSSENISNLIVKNIPNNYLIYYGTDSNSAVLADNIGGNSWAMKYDASKKIYVKPPENESTDITGATITAVTDGGVSAESSPFNVTINPIADSLTISPTKTFGKEGEDIAINLNANVEDLDGSETVTLTLKNLGTGATFKADGVAMDSANVNYDSASDTYTITKIAASDINKVTLVQDKINKSVTVTAKMVESDGSSSTDIKTGTFDIKIDEAIASGGADTLLYKSTGIDGLGGDDTLVLNGKSIDFSKVKNIETLDLTSGDNTVANLTAKDVLDMTDGTNKEIKIIGESADSISFKNTDDGNGTNYNWTKGSSVTEDGKTFDVYTNNQDSSIKVKVEDTINDTIV